MSPQNIVMNWMKNNHNPVFANLIDMEQKGNIEGVKNFARNICKEQGIDFDKEYPVFRGKFK